LIAKIILIPSLHFLVSVLLVGAGLLLLLQQRSARNHFSGAGNFLAAAALGILYNALQFALVLLVYRRFPVNSQFWLSAGKYAMDLAFLLFLSLAYPKKYLSILRDLARVFSRGDNAVLLLLSILLGFLTVINFPHVYDSGQLRATNSMLMTGADFLASHRYALGFSALCYFPTAVVITLPMTTLVSGFKVFLLFLAGMAAIYGLGRLRTIDDTASKFLYFFIIISSFFGLQGMMRLGKDSPWAVLFSLVFIFSLIDRNRKQSALAPCLFFLSAIALGMIAIPYLFIFCAVFMATHLLPERVTAHRAIFPAAVILMLGICFMLMPIKTAINMPKHLQSTGENYRYRSPLDGETSFYSYFVAFNKKGAKNSAPLIVAGLLGILLLPLIKKRFADVALRSTALFLPVATLGCLFLPFLARDFLPANHSEKIPLTPLTPFDAWNLVKDIPQWYVQIIGGIFFIILLDALINHMASPPKTKKAIYIGFAAIAATVILSANLSGFISLKNPARLYPYGGNKNRYLASVMDNIYRHPGVKHVFLMRGESSLSLEVFSGARQNYFPQKKMAIIDPSGFRELIASLKGKPVLLITSRSFISRLSVEPGEHGPYRIKELAHFSKGDGIFLVSGN